MEKLEKRGKCGKNVFYDFECESGTLILSGSGRTDDYSLAERNLSPFFNNQEIKHLIINSGVESIGKFLFYGCDYMKTVYMAHSVKEIGENAFGFCLQIEYVFLSRNLEFIRPSAFSHCVLLRSIEIPEGVKRIESHAFDYCSDLFALTLPESLEEVEEAAFINCSSLKCCHTRANKLKWERVKLTDSGLSYDDFYCEG